MKDDSRIERLISLAERIIAALETDIAILKDGKASGMRLDATSGDVALDRAAWGGITNSNPFPPLPQQFGGQYLALRFYFFYNPDTNDLQ